MNILLISECNKQALSETRRILDQFAERKGMRTWQTPITFDGLKTLRMLLKKTARRNTAVACYWIRGKNQTELLWIVGNRRKFNEQGTVPTNITQRDILRTQDENGMNAIQSVALLAALAGLFHDFGKANQLFQKKLKPKSKVRFEPYRHEWLSLWLFIAFVNQRSDHEWLEDLAQGKIPDDKALIAQLDPTQAFVIENLPPIAQCVAWLIVSHHRLPKHQLGNVVLSDIESWKNGIDVSWNALNHKSDALGEKERSQNLLFPFGTPFVSATWRKKAKEIAQRAHYLPSFTEYAQLEKAFPLHLARMTLMLADHTYSADIAHEHWQDLSYLASANTDRKTKKIKQKLDEHCIGVAHNAYILARTLPRLRSVMPAITQHKGFKRRSKNAKFRWQDKAYDCAYAIAEQSEQQGFFGVNMASTGKGKTFANARIMYGLSNPKLGCRFSVALGLRTLTLQTGDALQQRLQLDNDDVAVHIGSQAVYDLFLRDKKAQQAAQDKNEAAVVTGSESELLFSEHKYVRYDGEVDNHYLQRWLKEKGAIHKLISAPISVSTIDHLMPASEGITGGQQIAPMMRLLTSDLILDEPDDFSLDDDPALGRLVYFAGLLGSRVLLSSATLPPALVNHLFACYQAGRTQYNLVTGQQQNLPVCCAWFDEFGVQSENASDIAQFNQHHQTFTQTRKQALEKHQQTLHVGHWLVMDENDQSNTSYLDLFSQTLYQGIYQLANEHKTQSTQTHSKGKTVSAGIIRMANIEPLVAVANTLFSLPAKENTRIHYCVYHSQHPLAVRSAIENQLDQLLQRDRSDLQDIITKPVVERILNTYSEQHHIFVILATPVAEVGRDHDYDWAIIEPSSMRSIIQLAGRVQRHRQLAPNSPNILVLNKNIKALKRSAVAYIAPGFESDKQYTRDKGKTYFPYLHLSDHDLRHQLPQCSLEKISSEPRFISPKPLVDEKQQRIKGFIELEHQATLFYMQQYLQPWWQSKTAHLIGEVQKQTPFRQSRPSQDYIMMVDEDSDEITLQTWDNASQAWIDSGLLSVFSDLRTATGISAFGSQYLKEEIERLANDDQLSTSATCERFAAISLPANNDSDCGKPWFYHPILGVFRGRDITPFHHDSV
ncbi:type I-F CRISPR-associated helicase Cas3f (plasmid) [Photobacterium leiognathi subsp. mandapamensis]|uniref:type I-F CRISPR-associated helicase Cas3f n=1 Tax=Photobacterium leiognathi TaxID=553611 RepID=UPI003AF3CD81